MSAKIDTAITTATSVRVHKIAFMAVTPYLLTGAYIVALPGFVSRFTLYNYLGCIAHRGGEPN
jgi:hypothetical protein